MAASSKPEFIHIKLDYDHTAPVMTNFDEIYTTISVLGEGSFGRVIKIRDNSSGNFLAAKFIKISKEGSVDVIKRSIREVKILRNINLKNKTLPPERRVDIPEYYGCFLIDDSVYTDYYHFVVLMEYIQGRDLNKVMEYRFRSIDRNNAGLMKNYYNEIHSFSQWLYRNIANLHDMDIVHRDIKPANIVRRMSNSPEQGSLYVLLDLGLSCGLSSSILDVSAKLGDFHFLESYDAPLLCRAVTVGSILYSPPELLTGPIRVDTFKTADIWAAGILLWEMVNMEFFTENVSLTPGHEIIEFIDFVKNNPMQTSYMPPFDRIIIESLEFHPLKRPTAGEISEYLKNYYKGIFQIGIRPSKNSHLMVKKG